MPEGEASRSESRPATLAGACSTNSATSTTDTRIHAASSSARITP
jgi:hypothetical protein